VQLALKPAARSAADRTARARRAVAWTAAAISAATAYVHFAYTESHFEEWWAYGVLFLLAGQLQAALALALLRRPPAWVLAGGALVNLAIVGVYVASRTSGLPFGPHADVAERAGAVDLGTTAAEIVLVGLLISLLGPRARRWAVNGLLLAGVALWALRLTGNIA
jgi:hypothetical protein